MNDIDFPRLERSLYKPQKHLVEVEVWEQWHGLSNVHIRALVKLAEAVRRLNRPATRYEAGISDDGSEYGNFAAMRWWKLIESTKADHWDVTRLGWDFLGCRRSVAQHVLTLNGEVKGVSIGLVDITKVAKEETWRKAEYLANRIPHRERGQLSL